MISDLNDNFNGALSNINYLNFLGLNSEEESSEGMNVPGFCNISPFINVWMI